MGQIVVSEFVSLDGVVEDPPSWVGEIRGNEEVNQAKVDEAEAAEALLLGRRGYEFFSERWATRSGGLADRLNEMPKYVVSSTLADPDWSNSTVVPLAEVAQLKAEVDGEILVYGSFQLADTLMQQDLVDELRLMVYPVVVRTNWTAGLVANGTVGDVVSLTYR